MAVLLRVMCLNIAEGSWTGEFEANSMIPRLADEIKDQAPDIVLLNEVRNEKPAPFGNGVNQVIRLSELTGIPFRHWANTNALGLSGHKAVGILSRFPLGSATYHPVMMGSSTTGFGTLESSVDVDGMNIQILSTRFNPVHYDGDTPRAEELAENIQGHHQFADMMRNRNPSIVIFGGDFNSWPQAELHKPQYDYFMQNSGLTNTLPPYPEEHPQDKDPAAPDFIYYRGPFSVRTVARRKVDYTPTDHPFVLAELQSPPQGFVLTYGSSIKLRHCNEGRALHSHGFNYGHTGTSGQQQVTGHAGYDNNDWWRIRGAHGTATNYKQAQPVRHGDIIRLNHRATGRNLHSHAGFPSPVTHQQEVTCFGASGTGDGNDNWRVEVEGGGEWKGGARVRLIHVGTNCALHSHFGFSDPVHTQGQQEVTCFNGRDENDWWSVFVAVGLDGYDPF